MKSNILFGLGLSLSLFLTSCKDDDSINPTNMQVTMHSSSQTLVEGGEVVEVILEMERTYNELKYLYLEGAGMYMDSESFHNNGWITAEMDGKQLHLARIPMPSGERKRIIRLQADKDETYQGNSTFEIKVYSYDNGVAIPKSSMSMKFQDTTPKPVFGFFKMDERDVTRTIDKKDYGQDRFLIPIMADRSFTHPQKVTLAFSGTAKEGTHYEKVEQIIVNPTRGAFQGSSYEALRINKTANFDPEKVINIKLIAAEDGTIADGEEYIWPNPYGGEPFNMVNTYTLTLTE